MHLFFKVGSRERITWKNFWGNAHRSSCVLEILWNTRTNEVACHDFRGITPFVIILLREKQYLYRDFMNDFFAILKIYNYGNIFKVVINGIKNSRLFYLALWKNVPCHRSVTHIIVPLGGIEKGGHFVFNIVLM